METIRNIEIYNASEEYTRRKVIDYLSRLSIPESIDHLVYRFLTGSSEMHFNISKRQLNEYFKELVKHARTYYFYQQQSTARYSNESQRLQSIIKQILLDFDYSENTSNLFNHLRKVKLEDALKTTTIALGLELPNLPEKPAIEDGPRLMRIETMLEFYKNPNPHKLYQLQKSNVAIFTTIATNLKLPHAHPVDRDLQSSAINTKKSIQNMIMCL